MRVGPICADFSVLGNPEMLVPQVVKEAHFHSTLDSELLTNCVFTFHRELESLTKKFSRHFYRARED